MKYEIAIGDIIGSNIVDATLSLGIGPLIAPVAITASIAVSTGIYILFASFIMLSLIALSKKIDYKIFLI